MFDLERKVKDFKAIGDDLEEKLRIAQNLSNDKNNTIDCLVREMADLEDAKDSLQRAKDEIQQRLYAARNDISSGGSVAIKILRRMVDERVICSDDSITREEVTRYYHVTDGKIPAIKLLRQITGMGLKDSKEQVEDWID